MPAQSSRNARVERVSNEVAADQTDNYAALEGTLRSIATYFVIAYGRARFIRVCFSRPIGEDCIQSGDARRFNSVDDEVLPAMNH
jgi:hypothetical protein